MGFSSVQRWFTGTRKASPCGRHESGSRRRCRPPAVEELESRWTPAQIGVNDFRISNMGPDGDGAYDAISAAVAYNSLNNEYLVVWSGDDNTGGLMEGEIEIFGQRLDAATGAKLGSHFRISDMGPAGNTDYDPRNPAVAYNSVNNEYLVVWQSDDNTGMLKEDEIEIYGQRLNAATGAPVGTNDFRISDMGFDGDVNYDAFNPAVVYNPTNNEYFVVWDGDDMAPFTGENQFEIFGQRLNAATGMEVGSNDFRITTMGPAGDTNYEAQNPAVAYNGTTNEYLIVWEGDDNKDGLVDNEYEIFAKRLDGATGGGTGNPNIRISDMGPNGDPNYGAFEPAVAYNGAANEYLIVWEGDDNTGGLVDNEDEIFGQRLNAATKAEVGANDFRISDMGPNGTDDFDAFNAAVAYNSVANEYLVVWSGDDNTGGQLEGEDEIFGQRLIAATGAEVGFNDFRASDMGPAFDDDSYAEIPAVAFNSANNEYLIVWEGVDNPTANVNLRESEIFGQRFAPLDPLPPLPAPAPPPPPQVVAVPFRQKGTARVRVRDAATGAVRGVLTPFRGYGGRLTVHQRDVNGDGMLDLIVSARIGGKRRLKVFDARTLAPLPPALA